MTTSDAPSSRVTSDVSVGLNGPDIELSDPLNAGPKLALDGLIEAGTNPEDGLLPPLWHWVYFLERPAQSELGPDGHPRVGRPTPPAPGLRRMFAGGRVTTHGQLALGRPAVMRSGVVSSIRKDGRSGPLWFVKVRNSYRQDDRDLIVDERDIVYRAPAIAASQEARSATVSEGGRGQAGSWTPGIDVKVDPTLLFRFSALTYNAHRIHYDVGWTSHEGYGGLVVHGPLQALLLGELFRRSGRSLVGSIFDYRLVAPFVGCQLLRVRTSGSEEAVVLDENGVVTASATVRAAE